MWCFSNTTESSRRAWETRSVCLSREHEGSRARLSRKGKLVTAAHSWNPRAEKAETGRFPGLEGQPVDPKGLQDQWETLSQKIGLRAMEGHAMSTSTLHVHVHTQRAEGRSRLENILSSICREILKRKKKTSFKNQKIHVQSHMVTQYTGSAELWPCGLWSSYQVCTILLGMCLLSGGKPGLPLVYTLISSVYAFLTTKNTTTTSPLHTWFFWGLSPPLESKSVQSTWQSLPNP